MSNAHTGSRASIGWPSLVACLGIVAWTCIGDTARAEGKATAAKTASALYEVQTIPDILYYDGKDMDKARHTLDLYLPQGRKDFPALLFIHGGSWARGDKNYHGIFRNVGMALARHGIGAAVANYRLSPAVQHPEHAKDVARAFAWTYQHIGKYGGRADQLFLSGHSAGGHLVSLLATDETYLQAVGLGFKAIRGVMPISGVYRIPDENALFDRVFGTDPRVRQQASPITHVHPGLPPWCLLYAEHDFLSCGREPAEEFARALRAQRCTVKTQEIKNRNHLTIVLNASRENDPVALALLEFIDALTKP
jgi:acetyl esterase/lipase